MDEIRDTIRQHLYGKRGGRTPKWRDGTYSQVELARRAGIPRSTLAAVLAGRCSCVGTVDAVLRALGYRLVAAPMQQAKEDRMQ